MKHLRAINKKAKRIEQMISPEEEDVVALQQQPAQRPHVPMGCSLAFSPGWEVDAGGGTAGLCQPAERDIYRMSSSLVFSGPIPVASLASGIAALEVNAREGDALRSELYRLTKRLIDGVRTIGLVTDSDTYFPIVNVPLGSGANVAAACDVLWRHGIIITPSVFPAAPLGRGGVRFSITAANTDADVDKALDALDEVAGGLRGAGDLIDLTDVSERSGVQDLTR